MLTLTDSKRHTGCSRQGPCCVADLHHRLTSALHLQQSMLLGLPQFLNWSVGGTSITMDMKTDDME